MPICCGCGRECHAPDHQWTLFEESSATHTCNQGVAVLERTKEGMRAWCARCWTFVVNKMENDNIVAERRDAVANGRHWV